MQAKAASVGALDAVITQEPNGDIEVKRNVAYMLALMAEQQEYHDQVVEKGGLRA